METKNKDSSMSTDLNSLNINNLDESEKEANLHMDQPSEDIYARQMMPEINNQINNQTNNQMNNQMNYDQDNNIIIAKNNNSFMNKIINKIKLPMIAFVLYILLNFSIVNSILIKYVSYFSTDNKLNFIGLIFKGIIFSIILFIINYFV